MLTNICLLKETDRAPYENLADIVKDRDRIP